MAEKKPRSKKVPKGGGELVSIVPQCCLEAFDAPVIRQKPQVAKLPGERRIAFESFNMVAGFRTAQQPSDDEPDSGLADPCRCGCCEFRLYVRGFYSYGRFRRSVPLAGGTFLSETEFQEAAINGVDGPLRFGHRRDPQTEVDQYLPERESGCLYIGFARPAIVGANGFSFEINLEYRGDIIDRCNDDAVVQTKTWKFVMKGRLSQRRKFYTVGEIV